jgi:small subunit ribosomal protein S20
MANHKSAQKRIRQTEKRTAVNRKRKIDVRHALKKVEMAISEGNTDEAKQALKEAQPKMMKAAGKGVYNKGTVSRKMSRLSARIKKLAA